MAGLGEYGVVSHTLRRNLPVPAKLKDGLSQNGHRPAKTLIQPVRLVGRQLV